jgi:pimeloyl-ACP methyl ester carboxylesterase
LHLKCVGAGSPTVVLESGSGASSNVWALVQQIVSRETRVCSYDRVGFGWSDDAPGARPHDRITALRELLAAAGEKGRFVFVGHSLGGEYVRIYAHEHPEDLAGLVFIATSHPDTRRRDPALATASEGPDSIQRLMPVLAAAGVFRCWPESLLPALYRDYLNTLRKLPGACARAELAFVRQTRYHRAVLAEMEDFVAMQARNDAARSLGNIPLVVVSER